MERDFNHLKEWLPPLIAAKELSFERFARECGITRAMIYYYIADRYRPESTTMIRMCQVLGVPAEEGLAQYSPRRIGRPPGLS